MNGTYILALLSGALICTALFAWRLKQRKMKSVTAWVALPLSAALGLVSAKLFYFVLEFRDVYVKYDGFGGLFSGKPQEFCMVGGCVGVVLAVLLAGRIIGQRPMPLLDAFAPCGALMVAIARACEGLLNPMMLVGMGSTVMEENQQFFPLAVENEMYYSWFYAVFMLEAALALVCAAGAFILSSRGTAAPGRVFLHTVVFLALPQVLSEQFLASCMAWGFVRIEQLLCALIAYGVILYACIRRKRLVAYVPALLCLVCAAVVIWMEFTLDNKLLFGISLPVGVCYGIMAAALVGMGSLSVFSFRRLNQGR